VRLQPVLDDVGGAAFQDAGPAAGLGADQDRRVDMTLPQGEIVDLLRRRIKSTYPDHGIIPIAELPGPGSRGGGRADGGWRAPRIGIIPPGTVS
jgi:hypothetical protein